jgi:hypothetical protein
MILQKDLTLFRLDNRMPDRFAPEKYEYQLWISGKLMCSKYSDILFSIGKVTEDMTLELLNPADCDNRMIEDDNCFLVTIQK